MGWLHENLARLLGRGLLGLQGPSEKLVQVSARFAEGLNSTFRILRGCYLPLCGAQWLGTGVVRFEPCVVLLLKASLVLLCDVTRSDSSQLDVFAFVLSLARLSLFRRYLASIRSSLR